MNMKKKTGKKLKIALLSFLLIVVFLFGGMAITFASITKNAVLDSNLLPKQNVSTVFYDINGLEIQTVGFASVTFDELPENLVNAVVSIEDKRFFRHRGTDAIRIAGALKNNLKSRSLKEGASTISQQLIKNTHLTQEKSINRKLNEIKLARELERNYSKQDILAMYLNVAYFGNGMYGVKSAARGIFNKNVKDLTLSECACIAGILKNPSKYSPLANTDNAKERRNLVLSLMEKEKYIGSNEKVQAQKEKIVVDTDAVYPNTQSYILSAISEAAAVLNISENALLSGNYRIQTFLNPSYQAALSSVIGNPDYYLLNENKIRGDGLSIVIDNKTMGVSAYFSAKKRNIYDFYRPFGSAAKPVFVYAPALKDNLITPATPVLDEKTDFSGYMPKNYNDAYLGWTDVRSAVITSSNVVAVKTYNALGFDKVKKYADSVGINLSERDNNATVALGNVTENNMLSLAGAYSVFANSGYYRTPSFVKAVYDSDDIPLYEKSDDPEEVLSPADAYIMTDVLMDSVEKGTAKGLSGLGLSVASKTGTVGNSKGNTDAYNVAYTPAHTFLVWHGNGTGNHDYDLPLGETGGSYVTKSMRDVIKYVESGKNNGFTIPDDVYRIEIDDYAQKHKQKICLITENTPSVYVKSELFKKEAIPTVYSSCFDGFSVESVREIVNGDVVQIVFDAEPYLYYDIVRFDGINEKIVESFENGNDKISFYDTATVGLKFVKYYIKPYFYNQYGIKIVGNSYETDWFYLNSEFNPDYYSDY